MNCQYVVIEIGLDSGRISLTGKIKRHRGAYRKVDEIGDWQEYAFQSGRGIGQIVEDSTNPGDRVVFVYRDETTRKALRGIRRIRDRIVDQIISQDQTMSPVNVID